jgi:hypothetical protein
MLLLTTTLLDVAMGLYSTLVIAKGFADQKEETKKITDELMEKYNIKPSNSAVDNHLIDENKTIEDVKDNLVNSPAFELVNPTVSKETINQIVNAVEADEKKIQDNIDVAKKSKDIINFVIDYITNDNSTLLNLSDVDRAFANGVAKYIGYGPIYIGSSILDIREFDSGNMSNFNYEDKPYVVNMAEIERIKFNPEFVQAWNARRYRFFLNHPELNQVQVPGQGNTFGAGSVITHPNGLQYSVLHDGSFMPKFTNITAGNPVLAGNNTISPQIDRVMRHPHKHHSMNDDTFRVLEDIFSAFFDSPDQYYYDVTPDGKLWTINVYRSMSDIDGEPIEIDTGIIFGGRKISIIGRFSPDGAHLFRFPVDPLANPDITRRLLFIPQYIMSTDEVNILNNTQYYFNPDIISAVDMSNTTFLENLDKNGIFQLENNLMAVVNNIRSNNLNYRFRFYQVNDANNFVLVSDNNVSFLANSVGIGVDKFYDNQGKALYITFANGNITYTEK